jgi:hypothetical protein
MDTLTAPARPAEDLREAYPRVARMISQDVANHVRRHSADWGETLSDAFLEFARAMDTYQPERGAFTTWVRTCVRRGLERRRIALYRKKKPSGLPEALPDRRRAELARTLAELSDDARTVVAALLEMPEMGELLEEARGGPERTWAGRVRLGLANLLREFGWTSVRITETFTEIREAILQ